MLELEPSGQMLLMIIPPSMNLSGLSTMLIKATGLILLACSAPPLMLAIVTVGQLVDRLIEGVTEAVRKRKSVGPVPMSLVDFSKPLLKVSIGLVEL